MKEFISELLRLQRIEKEHTELMRILNKWNDKVRFLNCTPEIKLQRIIDFIQEGKYTKK